MNKIKKLGRAMVIKLKYINSDKLVSYILLIMLLTLIVSLLFIEKLPSLNKSIELGSIADWLSAAGTIGAVWFSLWMVLKEEKVYMSYYLNYPNLELVDLGTLMSWTFGSEVDYTKRISILCVANKSNENVQVRISYIRIIDSDSKLEVNKQSFEKLFEEEILSEINKYNNIETGYNNLSSGSVIPLIVFNNEMMHTLEKLNRYEIQITMDYLDKGSEIVNISSRTGDLVILHGKPTEVPLGGTIIDL